VVDLETWPFANAHSYARHPRVDSSVVLHRHASEPTTPEPELFLPDLVLSNEYLVPELEMA
jgi:hypothetical protein